MSVFIFVTKDRPINVALPLDQLNHFAVETFYGQNIYKLFYFLLCTKWSHDHECPLAGQTTIGAGIHLPLSPASQDSS